MFDSGNGNFGSYVYGQPKDGHYTTKQSSTLTEEEYSRLVKQDTAFSLALTETDLIKGICNHRTLDGMKDTLVQEIDGSVRCIVCGYRFSPVDPSMTKDDVNEAVGLVTDILQTVKMLFIDMPVEAQREFFQIIPLLGKVPQLFELATRNFSKHENYNAWGYRGANMGTMNMFNMLAGTLSGGAPMGPGMMGMGTGMPGQSYSNMGNPAFAFGGNVGMGNYPNMGAMGPGMMGMGATAPNPPYTSTTTDYAYGAISEEERRRREEEEKRRAAEAAGNTVQGTATFTA